MPNKDIQVLLRIDANLAQYIDALVGTTLLGTNRAEVVRSIVKKWIEDSMNDYVGKELARKANSVELDKLKATLGAIQEPEEDSE